MAHVGLRQMQRLGRADRVSPHRPCTGIKSIPTPPRCTRLASVASTNRRAVLPAAPRSTAVLDNVVALLSWKKCSTADGKRPHARYGGLVAARCGEAGGRTHRVASARPVIDRLVVGRRHAFVG